VGKKSETDAFPEVVDAALTFQELRSLLDECGDVSDQAGFVPYEAGRGAVYPVNGGMIDVIGSAGDVDMVTVSGLDRIRLALQGMQPDALQRPLFLELLACEGGCINGPGMEEGQAGLMREVAVRERGRRAPQAEGGYASSAAVERVLRMEAVVPQRPADTEMKAALRRVGKVCPEDELNCGGCGYETCRSFAAALLDGRAEPAMCLSYLRRQAQKKANALLRCMPSGVVIADGDLRVIECNEQFARLFGSDTLLSFQARPGLEGARIERILPFADACQRVLRTNRIFRAELMRVGECLLNVTVFPIEAGQTIGCIVQDVTATEHHREQIAVRAREVIDKNLSTVQDIACRLGEHMADTELLLRSIASDYVGPEDQGTVSEHRKGAGGYD
jgi:PAS domain-containing protein